MAASTLDRTGPVELVVSGMTCGSCATRVQKALARQEGVEEASVNFATQRATVQLDPSRADMEDLVAAVAKAGYGLAPVSDSSDTDAEESEDMGRSRTSPPLMSTPIDAPLPVPDLGGVRAHRPGDRHGHPGRLVGPGRPDQGLGGRGGSAHHRTWTR